MVFGHLPRFGGELNTPTIIDLAIMRVGKGAQCRARVNEKPVGWVEPTGPARSGRPDDRLRETHRLLLCHARAATNYRRNFIRGRSFFSSQPIWLSAACVFSSMTSFRRKMMGFAAAQPILRACRSGVIEFRQDREVNSRRRPWPRFADTAVNGRSAARSRRRSPRC